MESREDYQFAKDYSWQEDAVAAGIARRVIAKNQDPIVTYEIQKPDGETILTEKNLTEIPKPHLMQAKKSLFCFDRSRESIDQFLWDAYKESESIRKTEDEDFAILVVGSRDNREISNSLEKISKRIFALTKEESIAVKGSQ